MTIAFRSISSTPADNGALYDDGTVNQTFAVPAGAAVGDLIEFTVLRRTAADIVMHPSNNGGQTWIDSGSLRQNGTGSIKVFYCRFNGTWSAPVQILSISNPAILIEGQMLAFQPTSSSNTWAIDVAEQASNYSAPVSPFDVTRAGQTSIAANTVSIAKFMSFDNNVWAKQTAAWTTAGSTQYRNVDATSGRDMSMSYAYKIQTSAAATGSVVNRQTALGGDQGITIIVTYKEQGSGVTISNVDDELFHNTETGITITGTTFGASQGTGTVLISPTNNIADGAAIAQTVTSWADTAIQITAALSSFSYFTNLYVFVTNGAGQSNATGFIVQRETLATITDTLKSLAGSAQASLTGLDFRIAAVSINGTVIDFGVNGSTNGSGMFTFGPYTLTSGGALAAGDDVWVTIADNGASQALSFGTTFKVTPTYT